jgi:glycosyltransferase involved in cell wall biosynthesis
MRQAADTLTTMPRDAVIGRIGPSGRMPLYGGEARFAVAAFVPRPAALPVVALETSCARPARSGIERYQRGLARALRELEPAPFDLRELTPPARLAGGDPSSGTSVSIKRELWAWAKSPGLVRRSGAALLHTTGQPLMRCPGDVPHIVTLHDLGGVSGPERFRRLRACADRWRCHRLKDANRMICLTRSLADSAIRLIGLSGRKIQVIYPGNDHMDDLAANGTWPEPATPKDPSAADPLGSMPVLPGEYFLFISSPQSTAELGLLREAYERALGHGAALAPLVIVGPGASDLPPGGKRPVDWHVARPSSPCALAQLHRRAMALVFPGGAEDFGYPLLDAMSLDCPVICSRSASVPEIVGDAGLFAPPDSAGYVAAMHSLAADDTLRKELVRLGAARAAQFSWRRCASETSDLYSSLL